MQLYMNKEELKIEKKKKVIDRVFLEELGTG